ncbi:MAG: hypothetical protein MK101_03405 [Phycisphaerales bacterium]|nr:hypothetical protein [Phycisphaerales bacterium]
MARSLRLLLTVCAVLGPLGLAQFASAQIRVATWNVAGFRGQAASIFAVINEISLDNHAVPAADLSVIVLQEVRSDDYQALLDGLGAQWSSATYTNTNEDNYGGAQACFYRADQLIEVPSGHDDLYTGAGRRCDRWQFRLVAHADPIVDFYLYSAHLKAGTGSSNEGERLTGANRIVEDLEKLPPGTAAIVCGDFNLYDNGEPAYIALSDVLHDALGTGSWGGSGNAIKHTQSPRTISADGLASGGMDDRFDFVLVMPTLAENDGLSVIEESMRAMGNDGQHYNDAINDGNNFYYPGELARSNALADHLHDASDHVPVLVDLLLPARLQVEAEQSLGSIILGADIEVTCSVSNAATGAAADLDWLVPATGDGGVLSPGATVDLALELDIEAVGAFEQTLVFDATGDFVQHAPTTVTFTGDVLTSARPSLAGDSQLTSQLIPITLTAGTGVQTHTVMVWNHDWSSAQARLDIDAVTGGIEGLIDGPDELPTGMSGFATGLDFTFDTDLMNPGNQFAGFSIETSDEDLPGEQTHGLSVTFSITVEDQSGDCEGDVDGDGDVNVEDLLALISEWGTSDPDADLNGSGSVDIEDLLMVLADWGC